MIIGKTSFLPQLLSAAMALCLLHAKPVLADTYPSKIITIVVPTAPGGANDAMARIIAQGLSQKLGQAVVVENRAGANGSIASEYVARAPADGHVLMFGYIATHAINPALQKLRYDPIKSFEPIS
jgi:tripartite-type tricarboxylate transporter receptor subunit TctC